MSAPPPPKEVRIRLLDGPAAGTEYAVAGPLVRIGRGEDNDIVLPDGNASRNHAELVLERSGRYLVRDLGSRNGIFVNRKKVPQAGLSGGERILIGGTTLEFYQLGGASSALRGPLLRWTVVALLLAGSGFLAMKLVRGGGGNVRASGGSAIEGVGGNVSLGNLLNPSPSEGNGKGVSVGRNTMTKSGGGASLPVVTEVPEAKINNLMGDGERAYTSGKLVDARAYFAQAVHLSPTCGRCVSKLKNVERQLKKEIDAALTAGMSYMNTARYEDARRSFEKVRLLDPDPSSINNGNATRYIGELEEKIAAESRR